MSDNPWNQREVQGSEDLNRILAIPRRYWEGEALAQLTAALTAALKTPHGTQTLKPIQALALHDIGTTGGLLGAIGVGEGKTLITLLAAVVLGARLPLLIVPASLKAKTERERDEYSVNWKVAQHTRIISYESLGRIKAAELFRGYVPDLVITDESHKLKNRKAAVTKRVRRLMKQHPEIPFVAMSGTLWNHSVRELQDLSPWALKDRSIVPRNEGVLEEWADCLDEKVSPQNRMRPGALERLAVPVSYNHIAADATLLDRVRIGFSRRFVETAGVVATQGQSVACSIAVTGHILPCTPETIANFSKLRNDALTPDDWPLIEVFDIWRTARQLAIGMHYVWDPRPPEEWIARRKAWAKFARSYLSHSRTIDSELQVKEAVRAGDAQDVDVDTGEPNVLARWEEIDPTFTPNVKMLWHDRTAINACAAWLKEGPGIVWTEHSLFARELARVAKVPYFGRMGIDADGRPIEDAGVPDSIVVSMLANSTGRNLQRWSRCLVPSPPTSNKDWEQLIGRCHRTGQRADEVTFDFFLGCKEHFGAIELARAEAVMFQQMTGQNQKLLLADVDYPSTLPKDARFE